MTFQPPPPPPGSTPPPPPPSGAPHGGGFDPKSVNPLDWALIGAGVLAFLFSFIDFYSSADVSYQGRSATVDIDNSSAWHQIVGGGFFAWFAMLFAIVAAVVVALALFRPEVSLPVPARVASVGLFVAATVFELIAIFVTPGVDNVPSGYDISINHGFGFWASLIVFIAGSAISVMRAQQTNTALPGPLNNIPKIV